MSEYGVENRVRELLEPIVEESGIEILKVSLVGNGKGKKTLRVFLDRRGGIETNELEQVSRALSLQLDVEDLIQGTFNLEVSSPGLDWPLLNEADFTRYAGDWIRVEPYEGEAVEGRNLGLRGACVYLEDRQGREHSWPQSGLRRVIRAIDWSSVSRRSKKKRG